MKKLIPILIVLAFTAGALLRWLRRESEV